MRIRVGDPALLSDLLEHLNAQIDAVVDVVGEDELEASLLGSYGLDAMRMELYLRIRTWEATRDGATAELV
jgi:hypothetical protein